MRETIRFLISTVLFGVLLFGAALLLSGCESAKYAECYLRDNTSNPCNW